MSGAQKRVSLQPVYVLHQYAYRDSSLLVEIFSRDFGRAGLVCRGVRNGRSRHRGLLQPFNRLLVSWSSRGELATQTGIEMDSVAVQLKGDALFSGFYINELLLRLLQRQDPHPELFAAYERVLLQLAGGDVQRCLRLFEKRLLDELGYGLLLDCDADTGQAVVPDRQYLYRLEQGPVAAGAAQNDELLLSGQSLLSLGRDELHDAESLRDARRLMQAALSLYLGNRPLKTREVFRQMQRT